MQVGAVEHDAPAQAQWADVKVGQALRLLALPHNHNLDLRAHGRG